MKQKVITPDIKPCPVCGSRAVALSWNFNFNYQVMCDKNHTLTKECGSRHRAICKWNNAVDKYLIEIT